MGNNTNTRQFVKHPRYGSETIPSDFHYSLDDIESSHWRYASLKLFPESAIPADISRQKYAVYPRSIYVDLEEQCEVCKRPFIFFALEQKFWFETLGFWVDAHCTRCIDCRKKDQNVRRLQNTYAELRVKANLNREETKLLKNTALELLQLGYITDKAKIDALK